MLAKILRMPPPVVLTDEDLKIAEAACRRLAARYRRKRDFETAASWEGMADRIARVRAPR